MAKIKYFILLLIGVFFFLPINSSALELADGTTLPDPPEAASDGYVIARSTTGTLNWWLYYFTSLATPQPVNNVITGTTWNNVTKCGLSSGNVSWTNCYRYNNQSPNGDYPYEYKATTYQINDSDGNVLYYANYGLPNYVPPEPEEEIPEDFNIINFIASKINTFIVSLQENDISIHEIFVGLVVFNLLIFIFCYIIAHFE